MWLTHRNKRCVEIDDRVFKRLLTFYPEEDLLSRTVPSAALASGEISKAALQQEARTLFIPWQMFLLTRENLRRQLRKIESHRKDKLRVAKLSSRPGADGPTSNRLIDRYIRSQTFLVSSGDYARNTYAGMLKGKSVLEAVDTIATYFEIDREHFWTRSTKESALEYLVRQIEHHQINVALGSSESRLVPSSKNHRLLYRNISGFCLRDVHVPFIFVNMNLSDDEEPVGRRIYTLVYLVVLVGLNVFTVTRDWRPGRTPSGSQRPYWRLAHDIASEFLLPKADIDPYRRQRITAEVVREISSKHKLTPTATLFRLWKERCITKEEKDALTQPWVRRPSKARSPHIDTAVRKLNGALVYAAVNSAYALRRITQNQAQYILFGRITRRTWREFRARVDI